MATISSHVLDSVAGSHASGIRVRCYLLRECGARSEVFDVRSGVDGRFAIDVQTSSEPAALEYELVFYSRDYYATQRFPDDGSQIMSTVVVRLNLPDPNATYHIPIMLAPHSYSVWWSGVPGQAASA